MVSSGTETIKCQCDCPPSHIQIGLDYCQCGGEP